MSVLLPYPLRITHGHLNLLATCPRKFQHLVLEQLGTPDAIDQQERLLQGERFHLLLQQWLLALPVEPIVREDPQFYTWFEAFQQAAKTILPDGVQQPECDRWLQMAGYLLTVRYDLLISGEQFAQILDWKTYARPLQAKKLEHHWQTRLYLFVLAETSSYQPEQLSMVYWFFQGDRTTAKPQPLTVTYNTLKHEQTRQDLTRLLNQLTQGLEHYQAGAAFPQVGWEMDICSDCNFALRCGRSHNPLQTVNLPNQTDASDRLPDLADIQEIPL